MLDGDAGPGVQGVALEHGPPSVHPRLGGLRLRGPDQHPAKEKNVNYFPIILCSYLYLSVSLSITAYYILVNLEGNVVTIIL